MPRRPLLLGATLAIAAIAHAAPSSTGAPAASWQLRLFPGGAGTSTRFLSIADDGASAGVQIQPGGAPHAIYFNGRTLTDLNPRLGAVSSLAAINDRHQVAGYASDDPAARVINLLTPGTPASIVPRALFVSGSIVRRLSVPSVGFGINEIGEVAGTFRAPDGTLHGFLWRPDAQSPAAPGPRHRGHLRRGRHRTPLQAFTDLGPGDARAISDPLKRPRGVRSVQGPLAHAARTFPSLEAIVGGTAVWVIDAVSGTVRRAAAPPPLFLSFVDDRGVAGGAQDETSGMRLPTLYDLFSGRTTVLPTPPGQPNGDAAGSSRSTGLIGGNVANQVQDGALWQDGRYITANELPGVSPPAGTRVTSTPAASDTGLLAGTATNPDGSQAGATITPTPAIKAPLLGKALDAYVNEYGPGPRGGAGPRAIKAHIDAAVRDNLANNEHVACEQLIKAGDLLVEMSGFNFSDAARSNYEYGIDHARSLKLATPAGAPGIRSALVELGKEIPKCGDLRPKVDNLGNLIDPIY